MYARHTRIRKIDYGLSRAPLLRFPSCGDFSEMRWAFLIKSQLVARLTGEPNKKLQFMRFEQS